MTVLEKIKQTGGFADFGKVFSMPLGYYMDKSIASSAECYEVQKLIAAKKVEKVGEITNEQFPRYLTNYKVSGDLLKCK